MRLYSLMGADRDMSDQWLDNLIVKSSTLGSSYNVYILEDLESRAKYTLKVSTSDQKLIDEIITDALYIAADIPVPKFIVFDNLPETLRSKIGLADAPDQQYIYKLTDHIEPHPQVDYLAENKEAVCQQLSKHFIFDIFVRNVIQHPSNIVIDENGQIWRVDNGVSLRSTEKTGMQQGEFADVGEVDRLLSPRNQIGTIYQELNHEDKVDQAIDLIKKAKNLLDVLYQLNMLLKIKSGNALIEFYCNRLALLKLKFCPDYPLSFPDHPALVRKTAAGVLLYRQNKETNEVELLLLKRREEAEGWGCFAGESDEGDQDLATVAAREVREESNGLVTISASELALNPYIDHVTDKNGRFLFRLYFVKGECDAEVLKGRLETATSTEQKEHTDALWVNLKSTEKENISLFKPFQELSATENFKAMLKAIESKVPVAVVPKLGSPRFIKSQIASAMVHKAKLISQESTHGPRQVLPPPADEQTQESSFPSQFHLKKITGKDELKVGMKELENRYYRQFKERDEKNLLEFLAREKQYWPSHIALYHSCSATIGFIYAVYSAIMKVLNRQRENAYVLRLFSKVSSQFETIDEFISYYSENGEINNNENEGYAEAALSCNLFLFGNHENSSSSSVEYYYRNSSSRFDNKEFIREKLINLFSILGIDIQYLEKIMELWPSYAKTEGHIFQFLVPAELASKLIYTAEIYGKVKEFEVDGKQRHNPVVVLRSLLSDDKPDDIKTLQARLLIKPKQFDLIGVFAATRYAVPELFQNNLNQLVSSIMNSLSFINEGWSDFFEKIPVHLQELRSRYSDNGLQLESLKPSDLVRSVVKYESDDQALRFIKRYGLGEWLFEPMIPQRCNFSILNYFVERFGEGVYGFFKRSGFDEKQIEDFVRKTTDNIVYFSCLCDLTYDFKEADGKNYLNELLESYKSNVLKKRGLGQWIFESHERRALRNTIFRYLIFTFEVSVFDFFKLIECCDDQLHEFIRETFKHTDNFSRLLQFINGQGLDKYAGSIDDILFVIDTVGLGEWLFESPFALDMILIALFSSDDSIFFNNTFVKLCEYLCGYFDKLIFIDNGDLVEIERAHTFFSKNPKDRNDFNKLAQDTIYAFINIVINGNFNSKVDECSRFRDVLSLYDKFDKDDLDSFNQSSSQNKYAPCIKKLENIEKLYLTNHSNRYINKLPKNLFLKLLNDKHFWLNVKRSQKYYLFSDMEKAFKYSFSQRITYQFSVEDVVVLLKKSAYPKELPISRLDVLLACKSRQLAEVLKQFDLDETQSLLKKLMHYPVSSEEKYVSHLLLIISRLSGLEYPFDYNKFEQELFIWLMGINEKTQREALCFLRDSIKRKSYPIDSSNRFSFPLAKNDFVYNFLINDPILCNHLFAFNIDDLLYLRRENKNKENIAEFDRIFIDSFSTSRLVITKKNRIHIIRNCENMPDAYKDIFRENIINNMTIWYDSKLSENDFCKLLDLIDPNQRLDFLLENPDVFTNTQLVIRVLSAIATDEGNATEPKIVVQVLLSTIRQLTDEANFEGLISLNALLKNNIHTLIVKFLHEFHCKHNLTRSKFEFVRLFKSVINEPVPKTLPTSLPELLSICLAVNKAMINADDTKTSVLLDVYNETVDKLLQTSSDHFSFYFKRQAQSLSE